MDGIPPELKLEPSVDVQKPTTSLLSRLFNVLAAPGEVFEEVKNSKPSAANWLVPALILAVAGIISTFVIFSQPVIIQKLHEQQVAVMDQQVKDGKITQAQEDQALPMMEKFTGPGMLKIFGAVGAVIGSFVHVFWWAFVLWLMASLVLKIKIPFIKAAEIAGLAAIILVLGAIVATLLTVITGKLGATPGPALAISDFDLKNKLHMLLAALNVFNLWVVVTSASGLSRLTSVSFGKSLLIVAIYWLAFTLLLVGIGLGQFTL
jgi:hypothetical protein